MDDNYAVKIAAIRAEMPRCQCACGCPYALYSSKSKETLHCFACRHDTHFGGLPLLPEEPE